MASIMSMDVNESVEELYEDLLKHVLSDVSKLYGHPLGEITLTEIDTLPEDIVCGASFTAEEKHALQDVISSHNVELQHILCNYFYNAYPIVCDVAVDVVAKILLNCAGDLFDVYLVLGGYDWLGEGTYHAWVFVVGKQSGAGCYIDLTYIQFLEEYQTFESIVTAKDSTCTIRTYDALRSEVSRHPEGVVYPNPVIPYDSTKAKKWLPSSMAVAYK